MQKLPVKAVAMLFTVSLLQGHRYPIGALDVIHGADASVISLGGV